MSIFGFGKKKQEQTYEPRLGQFSNEGMRERKKINNANGKPSGLRLIEYTRTMLKGKKDMSNEEVLTKLKIYMSNAFSQCPVNGTFVDEVRDRLFTNKKTAEDTFKDLILKNIIMGRQNELVRERKRTRRNTKVIRTRKRRRKWPRLSAICYAKMEERWEKNLEIKDLASKV